MSNKVTPEMMLQLKRDRDVMYNELNQAKGKLELLEKQRTELIAEMTKLNVTPETIEQRLQELDAEIQALYEQATTLRDEIKQNIK